MERVGTLIHKLAEQLEQQADPNKLLQTAQMLVAELQQKQTVSSNGKVAVTMPSVHHHIVQQQPIQEADTAPVVIIPEPIAEVLVHLEEPVVQEVLAEVPTKKEEPVLTVPKEIYSIPEPVVEETIAVPEPIILQEIPVQKEEPVSTAAGGWMFDNVASIPTLAHQEVKEVFELNETIVADVEVESHNEKLKEERVEVASILQGAPIKDLRKAIGINDRYLFINELFRGDEAMYERSIKTINAFNIYPEAEYWIQREMKTKLGWLDDNETVKLFDQLVRRRFS
jgi:hypothetical protein